jgi:serine/threonine protein kinase
MTQQNPQELPTLRDYEVEAFLASGSSGSFFSGKHRLTGHPVALHRIAPQLAEGEGFVERLGEAARRAAALRNPHIVGVYDLVVEDGVFLVLELVQGASLRSLAPAGQALPPASAVAAVDDVLNALETGHEAGLVHGDIRAAHVLVTAGGTAKLGGWAVSEALQALPGQPGTGRPGYVSPERLAGRPPDASSDLYGTAALASELMTGFTPSPGRIGPAALPAVAEVLRRALSADGSRRYGSATELRTALIGATAGSMGPAWRLASDLGTRTAAAARVPGAPASQAGAATTAVVPPAPPLAATATPPPSFGTPPPPASAAALGGPQPPPLARPPVSPPSAYLPPPQPRERAAITEVDSEDHRRPPWLIPLIVLLVALLIGGGVGAAYGLGAFGSGGGNTGPLTVGTDVKLTVSPAQGGCDTTFTFLAAGSVSGAGTMTYRWERSDGNVSKDIPVTVSADDARFELPGPSWKISGHQPDKLTMTFHILKPSERVVTQTLPYNCP